MSKKLTEYVFSARVKEILVKSGWFPERSVDISSWVSEVSSYKVYSLFPEAEKFMKSFGYLQIPTYPPNRIGMSLNFNLEDGYGDSEFERKALREAFGSNVYPVGEIGLNGVFISENSKIILSMLPTITQAGNSVESSLENLIFMPERMSHFDADTYSGEVKRVEY